MSEPRGIQPAETKKGPGALGYVAVWAGLLLMTAVTVTAASINLGGLAIIACLAIAAVKSSLVLLYFMRLRFEKRTLVRVLVPMVIVLLAIFIGLTYLDVITRQGG